MRLLAVDPGPVESAYVVVDQHCRPLSFAKLPNGELLTLLTSYAGLTTVAADRAAIEMVASYGMAVGADVFETVFWIGRFYQALTSSGLSRHPVPTERVKRLAVKTHHCHDSKAKDTNIRQALVDRFALGQPNHGKGTKAAPGWFYGFSADVWQAYALAVYAIDQLTVKEKV